MNNRNDINFFADVMRWIHGLYQIKFNIYGFWISFFDILVFSVIFGLVVWFFWRLYDTVQ